jgi:hypothetical protein
VPYLKRLVAGFPPRRPGFDPRSDHVGLVVVDKVALGQVFSEYFGFPCQSSFHQLLHNYQLSSGAGTIGQHWPTYQVDSSLTPPKETKKKSLITYLNRVTSTLSSQGLVDNTYFDLSQAFAEALHTLLLDKINSPIHALQYMRVRLVPQTDRSILYLFFDQLRRDFVILKSFRWLFGVTYITV